MRRFLAVALCAASVSAIAQGPDPFAFYGSTLQLTSNERSSLRAGDAIVKVLPYGDRELAIFSAVRADVAGERLVAWIRAIEELKQSPQVPAIARFSHPPRLEDLEGLTLDEEDLLAIRRCRPGSCGVKLSEAEIIGLRQIIAEHGRDWQPEVQRAYRGMMLARVETYLAGGLDATPPYYDQRLPTALEPEFDVLLQASPYLTRIPELVAHFEHYPNGSVAPVESFLYWSKETLGGKPIVSLTHVAIVFPKGEALPDLLVASRQFYASHYLTGSLALTALVGGTDGQPRYLAYLNRSRVDVLGGLFGGLARRIIERRLRTEATDVVQDLRRRLESGIGPRVAGH